MQSFAMKVDTEAKAESDAGTVTLDNPIKVGKSPP
jgi:hypothetical protein